MGRLGAPPGGAGMYGGWMGRVELLAPAGTPDALRAAIAAGADAVYVGLGTFNARAANGGFSLGELADGCALAHSRAARVYVTLNVCLHDRELLAALELASRAIEAGADALIVADLGLCSLLKREMPSAELHLSTQAGAQSPSAVRLAARELGVSRVTCARELSVAELASLARTGVEIEAFCHGAICICYSGACAYSALMRGRSANRGDCTQPCRLAYELQDGRGRVLAGGAWERGRASEGDRLLCPRDYLGIRHVGELVRAGVSSLKIEGRMKGPDYVHNVVRCYRAAIDAALAGAELGAAELDALEARLGRSFSRGFTDGYLVGGHAATGRSLMSVERAINQGLEVGRVDEAGFEGAWVAFSRDAAAGDMLEIRSTPGPDAPADVPRRWPIVPCPADVPAGGRIFVRCKRKVEEGSAVHVVRSEAVVSASRAAVAAMRDAERALAPAAPESEGGAGSPSGEEGALGDTSRCSHARRKSSSARPAAAGPLGVATACAPGPAIPPAAGPRAQAAPVAGKGSIDLGEVCRAFDEASVAAACRAVARGEAGAVLCRNIGQIEIAREAGAPWEAAAPLNVWNASAARVLQDLGARRVWLPEELRAPSRDEVLGSLRAAGVSVPVAPAPVGSTPLMVMEHCLLTAEGPCDGACVTCPRRLAAERGERVLAELDRKSSGARVRVRVDEAGRTRLYR